MIKSEWIQTQTFYKCTNTCSKANIEGVKSNNLQALLLFIDFKKAFDSIYGGKMLKILHAYGIPANLVNCISVLYEDTKARVLTPDGETDYFEILAGVL